MMIVDDVSSCRGFVIMWHTGLCYFGALMMTSSRLPGLEYDLHDARPELGLRIARRWDDHASIVHKNVWQYHVMVWLFCD